MFSHASDKAAGFVLASTTIGGVAWFNYHSVLSAVCFALSMAGTVLAFAASERRKRADIAREERAQAQNDRIEARLMALVVNHVQLAATVQGILNPEKKPD
jgi:hypothetical protein